MNSTGYYDFLNEHNERLERIGNVTLNLDYWDCECESKYIHPLSQRKCNICGSYQEEAASSRENEVRIFLKR